MTFVSRELIVDIGDLTFNVFGCYNNDEQDFIIDKLLLAHVDVTKRVLELSFMWEKIEEICVEQCKF